MTDVIANVALKTIERIFRIQRRWSRYFGTATTDKRSLVCGRRRFRPTRRPILILQRSSCSEQSIRSTRRQQLLSPARTKPTRRSAAQIRHFLLLLTTKQSSRCQQQVCLFCDCFKIPGYLSFTMVLLVCPPAIRDVFPDDPIPFGPSVANLAGIAAGSSHWSTSWTCGNLLEFGKLSLSGFPNDNTPLLDAGADGRLHHRLQKSSCTAYVPPCRPG
jgi:hypothetical protein